MNYARNMDIPLTHLWMLDIATGEEKRLTKSAEFAIDNVTLSDDGKWAGIRANQIRHGIMVSRTHMP